MMMRMESEDEPSVERVMMRKRRKSERRERMMSNEKRESNGTFFESIPLSLSLFIPLGHEF